MDDMQKPVIDKHATTSAVTTTATTAWSLVKLVVPVLSIAGLLADERQ